MLKLLNTSVAKLVGATSAVLFQHICYWMQTQQREIIYRTNKQLSEDLDGIYSPQQIQRAKKKLIEEGLIVVTADKRDAWNRTSHYSLTDKGRSLLLSVNNAKTHAKTLADDAQNHSDSIKEVKTNRKPSENKQAKYERSSNAHVMSNNAIEHNYAMRESFKEGFSNANAVPMPDNIKNLIKGKLKKQDVVEQKHIHTEQECTNTEHEHVIVEQCWEDVVADEMEMMSEEYISDDDYCPTDNDYDDCQFAMLSSIEDMTDHNKNDQSYDKNSNSPSMTFAELMKTAYNKATTEAQEQMYRMKQEYFLDERSEYQSYEHSEYSY